MPKLKEFCCRAFVKHFLDLNNNKTDTDGLVTIIEKDPSPMRVLVCAALLDTKDEMCSFSEFVSLWKGSHAYHPILRLTRWVAARYHAITKQSLPLKDLTKRLAKLDVLDQQGFPLILNESGKDRDLSICQGFVRRGDYSNLEWMAASISHSCSIDWRSVKEHWAKHHITSAKDLDQLLSVCPNPAVCLESVDVKNLSNLIESSYETRLAERVLKSIPKEDLQHEAANVDSVYLRAAWFVFRHAPRTVLFSGHNPLHASPSLLPYTLLWAAQFCYSATSVIDECHWRSHFLRSCLVQATDYFFQLEEPHWQKVRSLWTQSPFDELLVVGEPHEGIPYRYALLLAKMSKFPAPKNWPEMMKILNSIYHKHATYSEVNRLYDDELFYHLGAEDHSFQFPTDPDFVEGFLFPQHGDLTPNWQKRLLTHERLLIPDPLADRVVRQLHQGVGLIDRPEQICIAEGKAKTALVKEWQALKGV